METFFLTENEFAWWNYFFRPETYFFRPENYFFGLEAYVFHSGSYFFHSESYFFRPENFYKSSYLKSPQKHFEAWLGRSMLIFTRSFIIIQFFPNGN